MIVLDTTIVNVALPSIREDLGFSETSLAWVVNAYLLTFGGFLLLGGRLGDLYGHRRLFLIGISALHAGVARLRAVDDAGVARHGARRAGAGRRGRLRRLAVADDDLFTEPAERAKAMGVFGFVAAGGGSIGVLLGGILTDALELALDLPGQPADRRRRLLRSRCALLPGRAGRRRRRGGSTSPARSPSPPR